MKIGFIGLGNVGGKLAGSLLRNGIDLTVHDLVEKVVANSLKRSREEYAETVKKQATETTRLRLLKFEEDAARRKAQNDERMKGPRECQAKKLLREVMFGRALAEAPEELDRALEEIVQKLPRGRYCP